MIHQNHLKGILKHRLLGPTTTVSDLIDLSLCPRICISNKYPVLPAFLDTYTLVSSHFEKHCRRGCVYGLMEGIKFNIAPKNFPKLSSIPRHSSDHLCYVFNKIVLLILDLFKPANSLPCLLEY